MYVMTIITCSCHVGLLNLDSSKELDSRLVKICRDSFFVKSLTVLEQGLHFGPSETRYSHWGNNLLD